MRIVKWILLIGFINYANGQVDTNFLNKAKVIVVTDTAYGEDTVYFSVLSDLELGAYLVKKYAKAKLNLVRTGRFYKGEIGSRIEGRFYVMRNEIGYFEIYGEGSYKFGLVRIKGKAIAKFYYQQISDSTLAIQAVFYFFTDNVLAKGALLLKPSLLPAEAQKIVRYIKVVGRELKFNPTAKSMIKTPSS